LSKLQKYAYKDSKFLYFCHENFCKIQPLGLTVSSGQCNFKTKFSAVAQGQTEKNSKVRSEDWKTHTNMKILKEKITYK
jgi:hypothetical protein